MKKRYDMLKLLVINLIILNTMTVWQSFLTFVISFENAHPGEMSRMVHGGLYAISKLELSFSNCSSSGHHSEKKILN